MLHFINYFNVAWYHPYVRRVLSDLYTVSFPHSQSNYDTLYKIAASLPQEEQKLLPIDYQLSTVLGRREKRERIFTYPYSTYKAVDTPGEHTIIVIWSLSAHSSDDFRYPLFGRITAFEEHNFEIMVEQASKTTGTMDAYNNLNTYTLYGKYINDKLTISVEGQRHVDIVYTVLEWPGPKYQYTFADAKLEATIRDDDTTSVRGITFLGVYQTVDYDEDGSVVVHQIDFPTPIAISEALKVAEDFLSQRLTREYFDLASEVGDKLMDGYATTYDNRGLFIEDIYQDAYPGGTLLIHGAKVTDGILHLIP